MIFCLFWSLLRCAFPFWLPVKPTNLGCNEHWIACNLKSQGTVGGGLTVIRLPVASRFMLRVASSDTPENARNSILFEPNKCGGANSLGPCQRSFLRGLSQHILRVCGHSCRCAFAFFRLLPGFSWVWSYKLLIPNVWMASSLRRIWIYTTEGWSGWGFTASNFDSFPAQPPKYK